jgi:F-type H+-transporting ATPase subunit a
MNVAGSPLASSVAFRVGALAVSMPVVTTWAIMMTLSVTSWLSTRRLELHPGRRQALLEIVVTGMLDQIEQIIHRGSRRLLPLLGTLFLFLLVANVCGLLPYIQAPTARLETPAALALVVFGAVHVQGIRSRGLPGYLRSFAQPKLIMLPLNVLASITRTFSLMVRLFGNVMSGEFLVALMVGLAGLFVPVPIMGLELLVDVVQAYIFAVLATVFIGAAAAEAAA